MIYIHFPFCKSFCTYCDFYSVKEREKVEQYTRSLLQEISLRKAFLHRCAVPSTLYVGGGTPSLWPVEQLDRVVAMLREAIASGGHDGYAYDEFTVEVNPDDVTPEYAASLRRLGVNRISMGVQSFSDRSLRWMNRRHNAEGAREACRMLRAAGFDNISMDLIFGYDPVQWGAAPSSEDGLMRLWRGDLEEMLRLRPEHISAYQMGVEEGSVLGEMAAAGRYREPSDELCASQYALLQQMLADAGYQQYEVSNFALPGRRAIHNSAYWSRQPYIGLGPGAHSFDGNRRRSWNLPDVERYIRAAHSSFRSFMSSVVSEEILTCEDVFTETIMLGLRTVDGLPLEAVFQGSCFGSCPGSDSGSRTGSIAGSDARARSGIRSTGDVRSTLDAIDRFLADGSLILRDGRLCIPPDRLFISDTIIRGLL